MSIITISSSNISGNIIAPPSKSCMQRACAAALLKGGETTIENYGISNDDNAAISIIKKLGATTKINDNILIINSQFPIHNLHSQLTQPHLPLNINCQESGLSLRMFTPIASLLNQEINITGSGSLQNRPVDFFDKILPLLNVKTITNNGKLPINIIGNLQPQNIEIDGTLSSQFLTGLLFAYSFKNVNATIKVNNLKSKPYIDLTLKVLADFGLNTPKNHYYNEFEFTPISQVNNQPINYFVEGDWSNASFLLIAVAIAGNITIKGLNTNSTQADKAILKVLKKCGCYINIGNNIININNTVTDMQPFNFDATDCPDLFPPLVALAAFCNGISTIKGVSRLEHKESNRASVLQQEFGKMGLEIILNKDDMIIKSIGKLNGANVSSNNDHRIAMACAVAALRAKGLTTIQNANAVNKSYPNFYSDLKKLGVVLYTYPS